MTALRRHQGNDVYHIGMTSVIDVTKREEIPSIIGGFRDIFTWGANAWSTILQIIHSSPFPFLYAPLMRQKSKKRRWCGELRPQQTFWDPKCQIRLITFRGNRGVGRIGLLRQNVSHFWPPEIGLSKRVKWSVWQMPRNVALIKCILLANRQLVSLKIRRNKESFYTKK